MRVGQQLQQLNQLLQSQLAVPALAAPAADNRRGAATDDSPDGVSQRLHAGLPSVQVDLSPLGRKKSQQADADQDIADSELPDAVKQVLKRMRTLKREMAEQRLALAQLMQQPAAQSLRSTEATSALAAVEQARPSKSEPEQLEQRQQLQTRLSMLNKALLSAQDSLRELLANGDLTEQQIMTALALAAKN